IKKQRIETWNLRNNNWELYLKQFERIIATVVSRNRNGHTYKTYKQAANELKRRLRQEKQEYLVNSIQSLQEGNTRQLFSQFKSMNNNKIS
ncbi:hypothetical protein RFI_37450, partial [Reticulomyxa filosa]